MAEPPPSSFLDGSHSEETMPEAGRRNSDSSTSSDATATARASFDSQAHADNDGGSLLEQPQAAQLQRLNDVLPGYAPSLTAEDVPNIMQQAQLAPVAPYNPPRDAIKQQMATNSAKRKSNRNPTAIKRALTTPPAPSESARSEHLNDVQWQPRLQSSTTTSSIASPSSVASVASLEAFALDAAEEKHSTPQSNSNSPPLLALSLHANTQSQALARSTQSQPHQFVRPLVPAQLSPREVTAIVTAMPAGNLTLDAVIYQLRQACSHLVQPTRLVLLQSLRFAESQLLATNLPHIRTVCQAVRGELSDRTARRPRSLPSEGAMGEARGSLTLPEQQMSLTRFSGSSAATDSWAAPHLVPPLPIPRLPHALTTVQGAPPQPPHTLTAVQEVIPPTSNSNVLEDPEGLLHVQATTATAPLPVASADSRSAILRPETGRAPSPILRTETGGD
eukprot:m.223323 g.223323  ORF g.223323 m.223323 type:complete len:448 (+) comp17267_c1_seq4:3002-4345(+)